MMQQLIRDKLGVAAIEYALVAALISTAALLAYGTLGTRIQAQFGNIDDQLAQHM
jgi:Flp pilus assembly pilin Flp